MITCEREVENIGHTSAGLTAGAALLPKISVVIPVLNDATGLARCLESIKANEYPEEHLEVLVADNGSTDGSGEVATRYGAVVIHLPGLSVAAVRNRLAAIASGQILAFVDADHELSSSWLRSAVDALRRGGVAAAGAPYHPPSNGTWVQRVYDSFRTHQPGSSDTRWLGSGNLAIWAGSFNATGGFDTSLTTCEDVDFCQRIRKHAGRLVADERLRSVHHGDPRSLKQLFESELWRGRDNLVVSLRGPLGLRDLPSIFIPMVVLASLMTMPAGAVAAVYGIRMPLLIALTLILAAPCARALAMTSRLQDRSPFGFAQAFLVASTYDLARALAMVIRKGHRRAC